MKALLLLLLLADALFARTAHEAWREGAALYVEEQNERALAVVEQGLAQFPGDRKLEMLKTLLEEQKQNQQNQNQQNQQNQNQQNQNQDKQNDKNDQDKQNQQDRQDRQNGGEGNSQDQSSQGGSSDGQDGQSRDSGSSGASSSSAGGAGTGGEGSSSSQGEEPEPQAADDRPGQTPPPGQEMTEEQARQLLESFADEDRKRKGKPVKGIRVPGGKDW